MSLIKKVKKLILGDARNPQDSRIFHKISLIAFFAWVGLGADGLSSSCYGPQEAFLALNGHNYLGIFVALATVVTIFVIVSSYSQIVELFPTGGGGYLVASKLLSPTMGMVSGCALLIDYVLTITVSIASGADAIFSLLPIEWQSYRLIFAMAVLLALTVVNMRGVKESVLLLMPIFLTFLLTHIFIIVYALMKHAPSVATFANTAGSDIKSTVSSLGMWGAFFLILKSYSMGAGTYTGIEAVSNGLPILREPKVQTARHTMRYMAISLSFVVLGLMLGYIFYNLNIQPGKTLNAILFEQATQFWPVKLGFAFILIALFSEACLLFVAAQTGFLGGPAVLANMSVDRWFPARFSTLSDRLVMQNGVLIMSGLALAIMFFTRGSVKFLIVLYSINVFITFCLSQLGMVRHWWLFRARVKHWLKKLVINGIGLCLCAFILLSMIVVKFYEGGWITLLITGALVVLAILIKRHYLYTAKLLHRLNNLVSVVEKTEATPEAVAAVNGKNFDPKAKTAVLLVNGFNGMGLHTLFGIIRLFGGIYKNFVFLQVGVVDVGNFKGSEEVENLEAEVNKDLERYVKFMNAQGFYAQGIHKIGVDVIDEAEKAAEEILIRFPNSVFFGGQLIFPKDSLVVRFLHNHTVFALQKRLYRQGIPFVILPIRV